MPYSPEFRATVIERALSTNEPQEQLAEAFGIGRSTIQYWLRDHRRKQVPAVTPKSKRASAWSREEQLEALLATHGLSEEELGAWCRQHGVHSHQLIEWRKSLVEGVPSKAASAGESRELRQENRSLKKQLRRKDKALAETAALLVLKKKAAAIWGEEEDD